MDTSKLMGVAMKIMQWSFYVGVIIFIAVSAALNFQVSSEKSYQDVDSSAYLENAKLFAKNTSFAWPKEAEGGRPYYVLGYPFFIGVLYKVFGISKDLIILFQVLLSLATGVLLMLLAHSLAGPLLGAMTFFLFVFNLGFLVFSQFILTEILLAFLLTLFCFLMTFFLKTGRTDLFIGAAFVLSISVLVKPAGLYFFGVMLPVLLLMRVISCRQAVIWLAVFSVPLALYGAHNKLVFNQFYLTGLDGENLVYWFYPNVLAHKHGTQAPQERAQLRLLSKQDAQEKFYDDLCAWPELFVIVWVKNILKTWLGLYTSNLKILVHTNDHGENLSFFSGSGSFIQKLHRYITAGTHHIWIYLLGYLEFFWSLLRIALVILGIYSLLIRREWRLCLFILAYLLYFSLITGHDGCARFRMLFEPLLILLSAFGLFHILEKKICIQLGKEVEF